MTSSSQDGLGGVFEPLRDAHYFARVAVDREAGPLWPGGGFFPAHSAALLRGRYAARLLALGLRRFGHRRARGLVQTLRGFGTTSLDNPAVPKGGVRHRV